MQGAAENRDKNRDDERGRKQDVFHQLLQTDEITVRDLRRL